MQKRINKMIETYKRIQKNRTAVVVENRIAKWVATGVELLEDDVAKGLGTHHFEVPLSKKEVEEVIKRLGALNGLHCSCGGTNYRNVFLMLECHDQNSEYRPDPDLGCS